MTTAHLAHTTDFDWTLLYIKAVSTRGGESPNPQAKETNWLKLVQLSTVSFAGYCVDVQRWLPAFSSKLNTSISSQLCTQTAYISQSAMKERVCGHYRPLPSKFTKSQSLGNLLGRGLKRWPPSMYLISIKILFVDLIQIHDHENTCLVVL